MVDEVIPLRTTVVFAHAVVQAIADEVGIDLLHIKGPAVEMAALAGEGGAAASGDVVLRAHSIDADVLVRPSQVDRLMDAMRRHGWTLLFDFRGGSPFEHASTLGREGVANVDVHRYFPGIELDRDAAFDVLWADRRVSELAGREVHVPSLAAQRLILIVHAARNARGVQSPDVRAAWTTASDEAHTEVRDLAVRLQATVALSAGIGALDSVAGERSHDLWEALSRGEQSELRLWRARVRASPNPGEAIRTGLRLMAPNTTRMALAAGRPLRVHEVITAYAVQIRRGVHAVLREARHRQGRAGGDA